MTTDNEQPTIHSFVAAPPPEAATVLVMVWEPAVELARLMGPVVALISKPVVEVKVPAEALVPSVGVVVPLWAQD